MNEKFINTVFVVVIAILISGMVFTSGMDFSENKEHKKAIDAGVGCYEVDPATGKTKFTYGVPKP